MREETVDSQPIVRMTEEGEGLYSGFDGEVQWHTESLWSRDEVFRPMETEKTFRDPNGQPLLQERTEFDHRNNVVRFEREDLRTGESTTETLDMPEDTLSVEGIAAALRGIRFEEDVPIHAHLFMPEPTLYEVTFETRGRETLRTQSGNVECYKVEVVPRLGFLGLFRFLLPKAYFWFAVESPYPWIRFEGPENGRGTPKITMERAS